MHPPSHSHHSLLLPISRAVCGCATNDASLH
jgi:hypothetical protein